MADQDTTPPQAPADQAAWANDATRQLQGFISAQRIASEAQTAGDQYVMNAASAKQSLVGMVKANPMTHDFALSFVPTVVNGLTQHHPDDAERGQAVDDLSAHFNNAIAHATVEGYAQHDAGQATAALDKLGEHLTPDQQDGLRQYIDNMQTMRDADNSAAHAEALRQTVNQANGAARGWLNSLVDPSTGQVQSPANWAVKMMSDPRMPGVTKAALYTAYNNVQQNGDQPSDPNALASMIGRVALAHADPDHPGMSEIVRQAGTNLSMSDAAWLAGRQGPQGPAVNAETSALADTLEAARSQLGNNRAFGRFVNWFMPAYRNATANGSPYQELLSPESKGYMLAPGRMAQFAPTGDDLIQSVQRAAGPRPSLSTIFGG